MKKKKYIYIYIYIHASIHIYISWSGPGSVVSIATTYGLDSAGIEIPVGVRFYAPVQTGPEAHPASCTRGTSLSWG
jgi:hypothetical protein